MEALTRKLLYELVWSEPISKIAPRYGLSDRGLGKLCARHDIPVPPRGYWAKKAAGKRVTQEPLSPRAGDKANVIPLDRPKTPPAAEPVEETLPPEVAFERDPINFVVVEPTARLKHPLVRAAAVALRGQKPDYTGFVCSGRECVDIRVRPASVSRALRIMQALILALEQRGYTVAIADGKTKVKVLGEPVAIYLRERLRRQIRNLTPDEQRRRREGFDVNPYELLPSGELALHIDGAHGRAASESKKKPLEDSLNQFIEALVSNALREKTWRAQRELEEQKRQEAERRRRERENVRREEDARADRFDKLVSFWDRAQLRRRFLVELQKAVGSVEKESELGRWLEWAHRHVESSDPLNRFGQERGRLLKVYYSAYGTEIAKLKSGAAFEDPAFSEYDRKPNPPGIALSDRRPASDWMTELLELELPEDLLPPTRLPSPATFRGGSSCQLGF
jgi:hypothetical protein